MQQDDASYTLLGEPEQAYPKSFAWVFMRAGMVWAVLYTFSFYAEVHQSPATAPGLLVNARDVVFNTSSAHIGAVRIPDRPDIDSWAYDLGGSTCACTLQWNQKQYFARMLYGVKYVSPHCATAFLGMLFLHRLQWVLLYKLLNEVAEEASMPLFGTFAQSSPIWDVEPRYDSLLQDVALAVIPFGILGYHYLYVAGVPDVLPAKLGHDTRSVQTVLLRLLEFYAMIQSNNLADAFGQVQGLSVHALGFEWNIGKVVVWLVQLWLVGVFELTQNATQRRLLRLCLTLLWAFFAVYRGTKEDEQVQAMLSFCAVGALVSLYQFSYTHKRSAMSVLAMVLYAFTFCLYLGIESVVARPPAHDLYYHRRWCGVSSERTDSCRLF